jgi:hypothetical protein
VNEDGLAFWIVAGAVVCLLLIAIGLLGAMVRAAHPEDSDADREGC